ncbi:MAG: FHA domain-containing protein [Deltaproteobacteria bacterium]|nr:FHA domain-containing protein [Deltaproteobacteria bacterium]
MNGSLNHRELLFKAGAGLAGGALGWLPVELSSHGHSLTEQMTAWSVIWSYAAMAILSGLIGGMIVAAESQHLDLSGATQRRFARGFIICVLLALPANYFANWIFSAILNFGGWSLNHEGSTFYLFCARVLSWAIMGAMLGAGVGISTLRLPNILKGAIGGWVGGLVGGLLFDPLGKLMASGIGSQGLASRFIGLCSIGLAIGLFIGLVQELTKAAWITVEQGRLKGRQYRVDAARVTLGRAEENPVGLFGDSSVQPRHAVIELKGSAYTIRNLAVQDGTFLNGNRIETAPLHDGDEIRIGGYQLKFRLRQAAGAVRASATAAASGLSSTVAAAAPALSGPCLIDSSGQRFALRPGAVTRLGRALDNDIVINHSSVSRHHASIEAVNGTFELRDLQSQNGTYVSDQRVTQRPITDGDLIRLGQAPLTFRA